MASKEKKIFMDSEFYKFRKKSLQNKAGGKALGFKLYPASWNPHFFVISTEVSKEILGNKKLVGQRKILEYLYKKYLKQIESHLSNLNLNKADSLIIRSSAKAESLFDRGKYKSIRCKNNITSIISKTASILAEWKKNLEKKEYSQELAIIIQKHIKSVSRGHLSNERRISNLMRDWLIEQESSPYNLEHSLYRFPVFKHRIPEPYIPDEIHCLTHKEIYESLHHPATLTAFNKRRVHFEWVWDGKKIWIVQADLDPEIPGQNPRDHEGINIDFRSFKNLNVLKLIYECDCSKWNKAKNVSRLKECGLPTTNLWIINSALELQKLSNGTISDELYDDLNKILSAPIVIRTELENSLALNNRQMLPRTDALDHIDDVLDFLKINSKLLIKSGFRQSQFSFLIHHYIPSTSSAYCYASPNHPRVRVDALWGIADGLSYYSHDSFEFNPDNEETIIRQRRFKDIYLKPLSNGKWVPQKTGCPWDWQVSIGKNDLLDIGRQTKIFAQYVKSPVRMMWFVDIPETTGNPRNLPWYYELTEIPSAIEAEGREFFFVQKQFTIRTLDDIDKCRSIVGSSNNIKSIHLYPDPKYIRQPDFIEKITELCKELDIPVSLQGSVLQHAYYQLVSKGVKIICTEPLTIDEEGRRFGKLVRDKIPKIIELKGETVTSTQISGETLLEKLREKIMEESNELYWAHDDHEIIEEITDLEEILSSYIKHRHIDESKLKNVRKEKFIQKGGFDKGVVLLETLEPPLINFLDKGKKKKNKNSDTIKKYGVGEIAKIKSIPSASGEPQVIPMERLGVSLIVRYEKEYISVEISKLTRKKETPISGMIQLELPLLIKKK